MHGVHDECLPPGCDAFRPAAVVTVTAGDPMSSEHPQLTAREFRSGIPGAHVIPAARGSLRYVTGSVLCSNGADRSTPIEPPGRQDRLPPGPPGGPSLVRRGSSLVAGEPIYDRQLSPAWVRMIIGIFSGPVLAAFPDEVHLVWRPSHTRDRPPGRQGGYPRRPCVTGMCGSPDGPWQAKGNRFFIDRSISQA